MVIQQRIPSKEELKNSPISFNQEELKQLKELRDKINQLTFEFGQININRIKLEETEEKLKTQLSNLEKLESSIAKSLTKKYGKGSIDLASGTFTPME